MCRGGRSGGLLAVGEWGGDSDKTEGDKAKDPASGREKGPGGRGCEHRVWGVQSQQELFLADKNATDFWVPLYS